MSARRSHSWVPVAGERSLWACRCGAYKIEYVQGRSHLGGHVRKYRYSKRPFRHAADVYRASDKEPRCAPPKKEGRE